MTLEEVKYVLQKDCMANAVLIGDEEARERYYPAIVAVDEENATVTYDYDLLVECFAKEFKEYESSSDSSKNDEDFYLEAVEWVDYNVMRSLPYFGKNAPFVVARSEEDE